MVLAKDDFEVKKVSQIEKAKIEQVNNIYVTSFPASERIAFPTLIQSIADGVRFLYVVEYLDKIIGFATLNLLTIVNVSYIEYIAVVSDMRNRGIGSKLLQYIEEDLQNKVVLGIILEVESTVQSPPAKLELRKRRIGFYNRNGFEVVKGAMSYYMPNLEDGGQLPLLLMWKPFDDSSTELYGKLLREVITSIYIDSYERSKDDELLNKILHSLKR